MAEPTTQRSPSPAGQAPVRESPGPRATSLREVIDATLKHSIKTISYANFAACFPTTATYEPNVLKQVWEQMVGHLQQRANTEFDSILQERATISKLNSLDALLDDARKRRARAPVDATAPIPPHTLPPETIYAAHLAPLLQQQHSQMNASIQTTQGQNAKLMEDMDLQHQEIERLVGKLESVVHDLEKAGKVLSEGRRERIDEMERMDIDLQQKP